MSFWKTSFKSEKCNSVSSAHGLKTLRGKFRSSKFKHGVQKYKGFLTSFMCIKIIVFDRHPAFNACKTKADDSGHFYPNGLPLIILN